MPGRHWTVAEEEYLKEYWGTRTKEFIAKKLNRSLHSIVYRVKKLKLGRQINATDKITIEELAKSVGATHWTVSKRWIGKEGLKATKIKRGLVYSYTLIDLEDFWEWAKDHKELINGVKFEYMALGPEPDWMRGKRKEDYHKYRRKDEPTKKQEKILKQRRTP